MKSKRRILVGDCSELYRKKKDRRVNLEIHVDQGLKDRSAAALMGVDFSFTSSRPVYFRGGYTTTQTGPSDEIEEPTPQGRFPSYPGNVIQVPGMGQRFRAGDVVFFDQLTRRYTTTQPTEGTVQPIGIAIDSTSIAISGISGLSSSPIPPHDHDIRIIDSVRWDVPPRHINARHTIQSPPGPEEDNRPVCYVVHPGTVTSVYDGDPHFISYARLLELYQVDTRYCKHISEWSMDYSYLPAWPEEHRIVHLHPQASGNYTLPERDRRT